MNKEEAIKYAAEVPGHFTPDSCALLYDQALQARHHIVEIGVFHGRSASILMHAAEETGAMVILIDSWEGHHEHCMQNIGSLMLHFKNLKFQILHMRSEDAVYRVPYGIDLLHVDGNHQADGIRRDCELYLPKVKSGGVVSFHDYGVSMFPGIKQAVDQHMQGWEHVGDADVSTFWRKP